MDNTDWEVGFRGLEFDELLNNDQAATTLWFLAGYLKGISDCNGLRDGERCMVHEPDGKPGWSLSTSR